MAASIAYSNVSKDPIFVGPGGASHVAVNVAVTGGDTLYYRAATPVNSGANDGNIASGSNATLTIPSWIASAGVSNVTITSYAGGGDAEAMFATWEPIRTVEGATLAGATAAGTYLHTGPLGTFVAVAGTATGQSMFYLDPALYAPSPSARTPKIRIRGNTTTNAVAPACTTIGFSLLPVATTAGASGAVPTVATVGAAVCTASFATPSATTQTVAYSSAVAHPAAGWYCFGLVIGTGGTAANANTCHGFELQVRQTAP